jgi:hypothetical protein
MTATTTNPLAPATINRDLRDAVAVRLYSDIDAGLSARNVTIDPHGDLIVAGFAFRVVATFLGDSVTMTRHATASGRLCGVLTATDGGMGSMPLAAILTALADH